MFVISIGMVLSRMYGRPLRPDESSRRQVAEHGQMTMPMFSSPIKIGWPVRDEPGSTLDLLSKSDKQFREKKFSHSLQPSLISFEECAASQQAQVAGAVQITTECARSGDAFLASG